MDTTLKPIHHLDEKNYSLWRIWMKGPLIQKHVGGIVCGHIKHHPSNLDEQEKYDIIDEEALALRGKR